LDLPAEESTWCHISATLTLGSAKEPSLEPVEEKNKLTFSSLLFSISCYQSCLIGVTLCRLTNLYAAHPQVLSATD
jgi:hypothetical protein